MWRLTWGETGGAGPHRHGFASTVVFLLLTTSSPGRAAETSVEAYFEVNRDLGAAAIDEIREELRSAARDCLEIDEGCAPAGDVLDKIFKGTFRKKLPDVVVYIEKQPDGSLTTYRPLLMWNGKNTPYVFGARHLYVLLVSDEKLALEARITTIVEKSTNPLGAFQALLGFTPSEPAGKEPRSSAAQVAWTHLGEFDVPPYLGWARLDIEMDSVNRLTIHERPESVTRMVTEMGGNSSTKIETKAEGPLPLPGTGTAIPFREATVHLSNSRSAFAGIGVALGITFDVEDTALGEGGGDSHNNAYALAKLYVRPPRLKVGPRHRKQYRTSLGVVVGTNVANDHFDELIVGLSVGHLVGKLGFTAGVNFVKPRAEDDETMAGGSDHRGNDHKLFVGVDYSF